MVDDTSDSARSATRWIRLGGALSGGLGLVALLGWVLSLPILASFGAHKIPMAPSTALLFVVYGIAILLRTVGRFGRWAQRVALVINSLGALAALLMLILSLAGIHATVEHLGFAAAGTVGEAPIGHMSPVTALCFLLASLSLFGPDRPSTGRAWTGAAAWWAACLLVGTSAILLLAYVVGSPLFYSGPFIPPAATTSLGFVALGTAALALARRVGSTKESRTIPVGKFPLPLAVVLALLGAGVVWLGAISFRGEARRYRADVERQLSAVAEVRARELARWREERLGDAAVFAENPAFATLLRRLYDEPEANDAREALRAWLGRLLASLQYEHLAVLDATGAVRFAVPRDAVPISSVIASRVPEILRHREPVFEDFFWNEHDGRLFLSVAVPIVDHQGRALGVVVLRIDPEAYLFPFLSQPPGALKTAKVELLLRNASEAVLANELTLRDRAVLKLHQPLTSLDTPAASLPPGREGIEEGRDEDGVPVIAALRAVPKSPWSVVVRLDVDAVNAPLRRRLGVLLLLLTALLAAGAAAVGLVFRGQRVRQLQERYLAEKERSLLIDSVTDYAIFMLDPGGHFVTWNVGAERLEGFRADEIIGQHFSRFYTEEDRARGEPAADLEKTVREGRVESEGWRVRKDGSRFFANSVITALRGPSGQLRSFAKVERDITERRRAEAELREREAQFRRVVEHINDALIVDDREGKVVFANDQFLELFGFNRQDLGRLKLEDYVAPEWRERLRDRHDRRVRGESLPNQYEYEGLRRDGRRLWLEVSVVPVLGDDDQLTGTQSVIRDITERKKIEQALRHSRDLLGLTGQVAKIGGWELDTESGSLSWTDEVYRIHEVDPAAQPSLDDAIQYYPPKARPIISAAVQAAIDSGTPWDLELPLVTAQGRHIWVRTQGKAEVREGKTVRVFCAFQDITRRHEADEMLRQAQKVEAIGRLAGGVAHDFNNILAVILGYGELVESALEPGSPVRAHLTEMTRAAQRGASLTRQLQAFARKQVLQPTKVNLNRLVANARDMLARLIGEDIELDTRLGSDLGTVRADAGQIDQILLNLALNARDAMPKGGTLRLETANVDLDEEYVAFHPLARPGRFVVIAVSDTGVGMDAETCRRIFEPFFTTKPEGQGTGLGLATVHGIVEQSEGFIWVYSEPGQGTTFKIYLPRIDETPDEGSPAAATVVKPGRGETILLVEDNSALRTMIHLRLKRSGYDVVTAEDGEEALALVRSRAAPIDLLLTDVVMPNLGGGELARQLRDLQPGVRVLYMSGYTGGAVVHHGESGADVVLLEKPFTGERLLRQVREILDQPIEG